jgi:hypothetical protein
MSMPRRDRKDIIAWEELIRLTIFASAEARVPSSAVFILPFRNALARDSG